MKPGHRVIKASIVSVLLLIMSMGSTAVGTLTLEQQKHQRYASGFQETIEFVAPTY